MKYWGIFITIIVVMQLSASAELVDSVLFDDSMQRLMYGMKDSVKRQTVIAHNITNKDVPGYKPIRFSDEMQEMMLQPGFDPNQDKVEEEDEMAKMTKNRFKYSAYVRLMNMKLEVLKKVINQGK